MTAIVDSTGMSFGRAAEWYEKKYGKKAARTPWRKVHLSIDLDMNVHGIAVTDTTVSDSEGMEAVLPGDVALDRVRRSRASSAVSVRVC
ncbi:transposase [Paraburkholderia fungorum]|uniref:transposase n=1 Tax=Paraburkholderia fungorum TaxID=134537 RepID=UPI0038B838EC